MITIRLQSPNFIDQIKLIFDLLEALVEGCQGSFDLVEVLVKGDNVSFDLAKLRVALGDARHFAIVVAITLIAIG